MENTAQKKIAGNAGAEVGETDTVSYNVKGTLTRFPKWGKRRKMEQTLRDCRIMASVEYGTVSISMRDKEGIMMTVRLDEMVELVAAALEAARHREAENPGKEVGEHGN